MIQKSDILDVFPLSLKKPLENVFDFISDVYEIRLIENKCVFLCTSEGIRFVGKNGCLSAYPPANGLIVTARQLEELTERAVGYSGFAHERELKQCFMTRGDGTRIGIAFSGCAGAMNIGRVLSLNIRLPVLSPDIMSCELDAILPSGGGLLIAGAPNSGKTTLLRYCCKALAGGKFGVYKKVCVIDERAELSGTGGVFDLGECADVISGRSKQEGILTALRLMSPEIIVCDEIGSAAECDSILEGLNSGVVFIASMHAADISQLIRRSQFRKLFSENVFSYVAFLSSEHKGTVKKIYTYGEIADEIFGCGSTVGCCDACRGVYGYKKKTSCKNAVEAC